MGRPMLPIDPQRGPVERFAAGLRELRDRAGSPPYRELARRAHYSATTLSVACSGLKLPSLDVTLALVRACGGDEAAWRQRWEQAAGAVQVGTAGQAKPGAELARRRWPWLRWTGIAVASAAAALALAGLAGAYQPAPSAAVPPDLRSAWPAVSAGYIGVSRCDPGSRPVLSTRVTLPRPVRLAGRNLPAGTLVGTVDLMYSARCSEGWPHFSPSPVFFGAPGALTLRSRSSPDGATNTSPRYNVIRFADGEPMLTVLGCVDAEVTIRVGARGPALVAATNCFQRA